ncbi:MAG TPA: S8 family serine peptidase, partial [Pyrinomonadaceae bacterium]|nr:S8 family serine peptidase [Pyrinomonadaceae bacterium]
GRGPTEDGRIKPDVVAPGTFILSAISRDKISLSAVSSDFGYDHGTSMATPLVAGCVAVLREFLAEKHQITHPSAALVKALLINGARDIVEEYSPNQSGSIPNCAEGFGRVDMRATVGPFEPQERIIFQDEAPQMEQKGQQEAIKLHLGPATSLLKVTLVWTDFPGRGLLNDLDLIVRSANEERHGNKEPGASDFDRTNNVEQVIWANPPEGELEIIVSAFHIWEPQSYALVIRTT